MPPADGKPTVVGDVALDLDDAYRQVTKYELSNRDLWTPDVIGFQDLMEKDLVVDQASRLIASGLFSAPEIVEIDKTPFLSRRGVVLPLADRVAYQAVVASIAPAIDDATRDTVFSVRLDPSSRSLTSWGTRAWSDWQKHLIAQIDGTADVEGLLESDLTSYFDCVRHDVLFQELGFLGAPKPLIQLLRNMLGRWSVCSQLGLPQGTNASRLLGNFYLHPVDESMLRAGWRYSRFMDDIRVVVESRGDARAAASTLQDACRLRGLIVSGAKTKFVAADEARDKLSSRSDFSFVQYLLESNSPVIAKRQLRMIFRSAVTDEHDIDQRAAKFCLYRLGKLRDDHVMTEVLNRLDAMAPFADVVASYLERFPEDERVESAVLDALGRNPSPYVASWLFGVLEARRTVSADCLGQAEKWARDRNCPSHVRALATIVMLRSMPSRNWREACEWIKSEADHGVVRAFAIGMALAGGLDSRTKASLVTAGAEATVAFLEGRSSVRSPLSPTVEMPFATPH